MQKETIRPELMQKVLQEKSVRQKIKILLDEGYSYEIIQTALKCSSKTISLVNKMIKSDELIVPVKPGPKIKITKDIQNVILS